MRKIGMALALLLGMVVSAQAKSGTDKSPVFDIVKTADGPVVGPEVRGVYRFLGIPYAKPPIGELRWMPPQPVAKWTGVRIATKFGPTCAQVTTLGPFAGPPNSNEDCLYLNVFTQDVKAKRPVLVWIHGGGYFDGASNDYDAAKLVTRGKLVVVTFNYRLNLFGFLAHPVLEKAGQPAGNYGVMDMQAVLHWVQRNIAAFGGDPANVTLGGQSAGAGATAANLLSPGAKGLFHRAILQSGGYTPFATKATAEDKGKKFAATAGCTTGDVAKCLRALPAAKIASLAGTASATSPLVGGPFVDGQTIPRQTIDALQSGAFNKMPVMIGTTRDEGNFTNGIAQYFKPGRVTLTEADFRGYLQKTYGGNAGPGGGPPAYPKDTIGKVLARYPIGKMPKSVEVAVNTDGTTTWNGQKISEAEVHQRMASLSRTYSNAQMAWDAAHSDVQACRGQYMAAALAPQAPVYMYRFDDRTAPSYFPKMPGYQPLAYHTADIAYLFTGYHGGPEGEPIKPNAAQTKLSDRLVTAWANFARTGNPNSKDDAPWPRWKKGDAAPAYFLQDNDWKTVQTNAQFAATHQCGFWQTVLLYK